jgi:hypothetical protein
MTNIDTNAYCVLCIYAILSTNYIYKSQKSFADLVRSKTWTNDSNSTEALEAYNVSYIVNALEA